MHDALRQDLIDIIAGIRDFLGQPVGLEHAILGNAVEKISRMLNDEGQFGQEHDREASPKDGDLAKRRFDPRTQKNERNQHVYYHEGCDDLGIQIHAIMERQQHSGNGGPPGASFADTAQQKVKFERDQPGALDVCDGHRPAEVKMVVGDGDQAGGNEGDARPGNLPREQVDRRDGKRPADCRGESQRKRSCAEIRQEQVDPLQIQGPKILPERERIHKRIGVRR